MVQLYLARFTALFLRAEITSVLSVKSEFFSLKSCNGDIILTLNKQTKDINLSYNNGEIVLRHLRWLIIFDNYGERN